MLKRFAISALAVAALLAPATRGNASDLGKALAITGISVGVGCVTGLLKCKRPAKQPHSSAQHQQNKRIQTALNTFGFPVGAADGVIGGGTKSGISNYQAYMGYVATGQLTDLERNILLNGLAQFEAGQSGQYMAALQRDGTKGMLKGLRGDPGYVEVTQPIVPEPVNPIEKHQPFPENKPLPIIHARADIVAVSMSDRCEFIQLISTTNGVVTAGKITDPDRALTEQFCAMRSDAIGDGAQVMNHYGIESATTINDICGPVKQAMKPHFVALSSGEPEALSSRAAQTVTALGLTDPSMIKDYAKMCLSAGYTSDDPEIALSGAIMMISAKEYTYAETLAHHLREGFGVTPDVAGAIRHYQAALSTLDLGAQPAFLPEQAQERQEVIRGSVAIIRGDAGGEETAMVDPVQSMVVLPLLQKQ